MTVRKLICHAWVALCALSIQACATNLHPGRLETTATREDSNVDIEDVSSESQDHPTTFVVTSGKTSFTASLPANSLATYVWKPGGQPGQWLTTAKMSGFEQRMEHAPIQHAGTAKLAIEVDPNKTYQTIDGFGVALPDSAAKLIEKSPARDTIMKTLFGTGDEDAAMTIVRVPMGSSDLMYDPNDLHTYEDTPGHFDISSDGTTIQLLKQAQSITDRQLKIIGVPWTLPGWMKYDKSLFAQSCYSDDNELDPKHYDDYVSYFVDYVNAYSKADVRPWMISMQNEPKNCKTEAPTSNLTADDEIELSKLLRSRLPGDVKILGWDHNRNNSRYVNKLVANGSVDAIGYHCYQGSNYKDQAQRLPTYMTECTSFTDRSRNVPRNMAREAADWLIGPLRYGSKGSVYWSAAQRSDSTPRLAGNDACDTCRGMITIGDDEKTFQPSQDFYFWWHFSHFVRLGAIRIASSQSGNLSTVAFKQGDEIILVVLNSAWRHADGGHSGVGSRD